MFLFKITENQNIEQNTRVLKMNINRGNFKIVIKRFLAINPKMNLGMKKDGLFIHYFYVRLGVILLLGKNKAFQKIRTKWVGLLQTKQQQYTHKQNQIYLFCGYFE